METILVKIFATALALSQITTTPDAVKTQFDRVRDQEQVAQLLHAGCTHMRKAFDIEDINLEELIATALDDPEAVGENTVFRGINFADLQMAYREFCKNERVVVLTVDLGDVIDFYNKATADLPDHTELKGLKRPGASVVLDRKGERFAEVFEENQRRVWVPLADIPEHVQKAFLAAEDNSYIQSTPLKPVPTSEIFCPLLFKSVVWSALPVAPIAPFQYPWPSSLTPLATEARRCSSKAWSTTRVGTT